MDPTVQIQRRLRRFEAYNSRYIFASVASEYKLSSYQDAVFIVFRIVLAQLLPDVRVICERVLRFLVAVNESLEQRSGGAKDSNAFERHKTTKATHPRGEPGTDSCHLDRCRTQTLSTLRPLQRCVG